MKNLISAFAIGCLLCFSCCKHEISNEKEYMQWLSKPDNGLVLEKFINGVRITVKYLPAEYLAYNECKSMKNQVTGKVKDSLTAYYSHSKTFLLNIGPDTRKGAEGGDIMFADISKMEEYKERNMLMNFDMESYISLVTPEASYQPVLSNMENTYGLSDSRNIYVVFSEKDNKGDMDNAEQLDFVFDDAIFETGRSHFIFDKKNLNNIPHFIF